MVTFNTTAAIGLGESVEKRSLDLCHTIKRRPTAHNRSATDDNSKVFLDIVDRFQPLEHITRGAITRTCFVVLAIVSSIMCLSTIGHETEPLSKTIVVLQSSNYKATQNTDLPQPQHNTKEDKVFYPGNVIESHNSSGIKEDEQKTVKSKNSLNLSDLAVARLIVADSIAEYTGSCACPYHSGRNGASCANRSAYSHGSRHLCYVTDVTPAMIREYRATH
jgi:hypothetical protein